MTTTQNPRIRRWFEDDRIAESILGDGSMFIPDIDDSTQHDRILVLGQLFDWAEGDAKGSQARAGIKEAIARSLARHEVGDALDIAWCLLILADLDESEAPVDWGVLESSLVAEVAKDGRIDQGWASTVLDRLASRTARPNL